MYYRFIASGTQCKVMRITITKGSILRCTGFPVILLSLSIAVCIPCVTAQSPPPLIIEVYDTNTSNALQSSIVFEGKSYDIAIGTEESIGFVVNVTITVPWNTSTTTNETPFITIQVPPWAEYRTFLINASKVGYLSAEQTLSVMKGALSLRTDYSVVKEADEFQVTVRDQDNQPVEGAFVFFDPDGTRVSTDAQGIGFLNAPAVTRNTNFTLKTIKEGYINSSASILVENVAAAPIFGDNVLIQVVPILFAAVAVIFAVLYVRWRKRKQRDIPSTQVEHAVPREESAEGSPDLEKRGRGTPATSRRMERGATSMSSSESKIEEIRIPQQEKRKETTVLSPDAPLEPTQSRQKKDQDEWFKGEEYMRYKLDEMTGSIDRKNEGKWFEGERDIQSKVDEALKRQSKKKKANQDIK
jgi:hypothetical protein